MSRKRVIALFFILTELTLIVCLNFRPKNFKVENFSTCKEKQNWTVYFGNVEISTPKMNLYLLSGLIEVTENLTVPLGLSMSVTRCTLDRSHCEDYDHLTITKLCSKLRDTKAIWAPVVNMISPPPLCPVAAGQFRMTNATANLSAVSRLPLEGYRWLVKTTVHPDADKANPYMCVDIEVSITNQKRRQD